jgi:hypothetical protein
MKNLVIHALAVCAFVSCSLAAQPAPAEVRNPFYSADEYQLAHSMFDRIQNDLDQAQTNAYGPRFDSAHNALTVLEQNWDRAHFDSNQIANTISAIQMVLNDNRLMPHDHDALSDDVSRLLDFQTEYYG